MWDIVTKPTKKEGGLEVGSLDSTNLALLAKWWWRLKNNNDSFWFSCIKSIHNIKLLDSKPLAKKKFINQSVVKYISTTYRTW